MIHTIVWRVATVEALDFWERRLEGEAGAIERSEGRLHFEDPEGVGLELAVVETGDEPLVADYPEIPPELALQGFDGVRAFAAEPERSRPVFEETLGFQRDGETSWEARGEHRGGWFAFEPPPAERGVGGAGTVHHVAFASTLEELDAWQLRVAETGLQPTPVIDRFYFRSVYFREPNGVLFELATIGPGFGTDEDPAHLGERLSLPPAFEHLREQIEPRLTKLPDPRAAWKQALLPPVADAAADAVADTVADAAADTVADAAAETRS